MKSSLDPLQFFFQPHLGVDNTIIYLLHLDLDRGTCTVRITFFNFSSAFNTVQQLLLREKLPAMRADMTTISWITSYLKSRLQFTLHTADFQYNSRPCHMKFSNDSAVVGCISDGQEEEYKTLVNNFVEWSGRNHLLLNVAKSPLMVIDFRWRRMATQPLCILGKDFGVVKDYKYLGVHMESRQNWKTNTEAVYNKEMSRSCFLRKLRSFIVYSKMVEIFSKSVVAIALHFTVVCWREQHWSRGQQQT